MNPIATARDPERATELRGLATDNRNVIVEGLDVQDVAAIKALAAKYAQRPVDLLLNNAGVLGDVKRQMLGELSFDEFQEVMAVNVYGPLAMAEAFRDNVAASQEKKIVSITSRSGIISLAGSRGPYFYRASKTALNMITRVLADDLRQRGVIVAVVAPPPTDTDMLQELIGPAAARQARPADVVARLIIAIEGLTAANSGEAPVYFDGTPLPW